MRKTAQYHCLTTHRHTQTHTQCRKYVVHHCQSLKNFCINYGHRAQYLSAIQVAPEHVNEILTMGTERVKSEDPDLRR